MIRRAPLALASLALAACTAYWAGTRHPSDAIRIPHAVHAQAKVDCLACHEAIYDAKSLTEQTLPLEAKCLECHGDEKKRGNCAFCHTDVTHARAWPKPPPTLAIAHAPHIDLVKEDCKRCHAKLPDPLRTHALTPTMASCLGCHEHREEYDDGRCARCHVGGIARFGERPLGDFRHRAGFGKSHGASALAAPEACAACHEQTYCADCHAQTTALPLELKLPEAVERELVHRGDFLSRHTLEAAADPASCRRCHGSSFCESCHQAEGLTPFSQNPRDPHPLGWSIPGAARFHGTEARRDISSCAPCHDQGARSICVDCHKVGGLGGNPHPPGFTDRHPMSEIRKNGMCLACHL